MELHCFGTVDGDGAACLQGEPDGNVRKMVEVVPGKDVLNAHMRLWQVESRVVSSVMITNIYRCSIEGLLHEGCLCSA